MIIQFLNHHHTEIIKILQNIQSEGSSYFFENMTDQELSEYWFKKNFKCFVFEVDGKVGGSYIIGCNADGRFSHIANASYIVSKSFQGLGIGKKMGEHSIMIAKSMGFLAMQFNQVVSTNVPAVNLWKSLGFEIIGIVPNGFRNKNLDFVDQFIMYKKLI